MIRTFPGMFALRFPFRAPEDDLGGGEVDPFIEQPGDREPEPEAEAAAPEPEAEEPEAEATAEEEPEAAEEPAAEAAEAGEGEAGEEEPPARKTTWKDKQIAKRNKELAETRELLKASEARAKALEALTEAPDDEQAAARQNMTKEDLRKEVEKEVRQEAYYQKINTAADAMFDAGAKAFPKSWNSRVSEAADALRDEIAGRPDFLEVVTSLDNGAAVYHDLAGDLDRMEAVLAMPAHKMALELAKVSTKLSAIKTTPISRVPAPIKPLDKPSIEEKSLEDLANDPTPAGMAAFEKKMRAEEERMAKARH